MTVSTGPDTVPTADGDVPQFPAHMHVFEPSGASQLTSIQLRKISLYRGVVHRCHCGFIVLPDFDPPLVYSRNGSRIPWEPFSQFKRNNTALYPSSPS